MELADFLHSVGLSGTLQHTRKFPSKSESYYVIRLRNPGLIQKYIIVHDDHQRSNRCSLSIQRYEYNLASSKDFLDAVDDLNSISLKLNSN